MGFFDFFKSDIKKKIKNLLDEVLISKDRFKNSKDEKASRFCFYIQSRLKNCRNEKEFEQIEKDWKDFLKQFENYEEEEYSPNPDFYDQPRFRNFHIITPDFYETETNYSSNTTENFSGKEGEFSGGGASNTWENSESSSSNHTDNS